MCETLAISMFCGLPVMVATLPMFEAVASASRYGSGRWPRAIAISMTIGVKIRQMVSLTKSAERMPLTNTTATSSSRGSWTRCATARTTSRKKPAMRRCAISTIIPNSRISVRKSIAA